MCDLPSNLPSEFLNGRAGYLNTLLDLKREMREASVPSMVVRKAVEEIIRCIRCMPGMKSCILEQPRTCWCAHHAVEIVYSRHVGGCIHQHLDATVQDRDLMDASHDVGCILSVLLPTGIWKLFD